LECSGVKEATVHHPNTLTPQHLNTLLWDIDGTLIDTTSLIVAALDHTYQTFLHRTLPADEIRAIIGIPLYEQIRIFGEPTTAGIDPAAMEAEFIRFYETNRHLERVIPEAVETLIAGKQAGRKTALVTSKNHAEIRNTLPRLGILEFVDAIVSADDVTNPKPDPEGVLLALDKLGSGANEALFIGDTVHDMRAGKSAVVARCAVTWGAGPRTLLVAEGPEFLCDQPGELRCLLSL
jgi:pyrophosphatase PpaX